MKFRFHRQAKRHVSLIQSEGKARNCVSKTKPDFLSAHICFQMFVNVKSFSGGVNMFICARSKKKSTFPRMFFVFRPADIKVSLEEKQPLDGADLE